MPRSAAQFSFLLVAASIVAPICSTTARADANERSKAIFTKRCTACHTFGRGVKVGPDLKGVTQRRQLPWLMRFIRSSQTVIASGDPIAKAMFNEFKGQRMPDWPDLTDADLRALLNWLAENGPEQKPADERTAQLASAAEVGLGRKLFHGEAPLSNGGLSCTACHRVQEQGRAHGGTMATDLSDVYLRFRDPALTLFLKHPCSTRTPEISSTAYLTPSESFAIKAYLHHVAASAAGGQRR